MFKLLLILILSTFAMTNEIHYHYHYANNKQNQHKQMFCFQEFNHCPPGYKCDGLTKYQPGQCKPLW